MKSIFKLNKLHLFLIVIFVLLASSLGFSMIEYFQSEIQPENEALNEGSTYDPFNNGNYDYLILNKAAMLINSKESLKEFIEINNLDLADSILSYCGLKKDNKEFNVGRHLLNCLEKINRNNNSKVSSSR